MVWPDQQRQTGRSFQLLCQLFVLSVETDNANLEQFVKSRLNYEKVELEEYREGKTYTIPVRITE